MQLCGFSQPLSLGSESSSDTFSLCSGLVLWVSLCCRWRLPKVSCFLYFGSLEEVYETENDRMMVLRPLFLFKGQIRGVIKEKMKTLYSMRHSHRSFSWSILRMKSPATSGVLEQRSICLNASASNRKLRGRYILLHLSFNFFQGIDGNIFRRRIKCCVFCNSPAASYCYSSFWISSSKY